MEPIQGLERSLCYGIMLTATARFKSLKFLLTDSRVPRDTKALVAGVGARKQKVREGISINTHFDLLHHPGTGSR